MYLFYVPRLYLLHYSGVGLVIDFFFLFDILRTSPRKRVVNEFFKVLVFVHSEYTRL